MTREEYDALIRQKEEIRDKLDQFGIEIEQILDAMKVTNDGECKIDELVGSVAEIRYLKPGCHGSCCGKDYGYVKIPARWVFGADWQTELKAQLEAEARFQAEKELEEAAQERLAQEQRDIEEFGRLKEKFEPKA